MRLQVVAFIHGHRYESWHSADMTHVLPNLRWDEVTYTDINRKVPPACCLDAAQQAASTWCSDK